MANRRSAIKQTDATRLLNEQDPPRPIILHLRQRFGLSALEGCEAVALAARFQRAHV